MVRHVGAVARGRHLIGRLPHVLGESVVYSGPYYDRGPEPRSLGYRLMRSVVVSALLAGVVLVVAWGPWVLDVGDAVVAQARADFAYFVSWNEYFSTLLRVFSPMWLQYMAVVWLLWLALRVVVPLMRAATTHPVQSW